MPEFRILMALAALALGLGTGCTDAPFERPGPRTVVLVSIDTLRPDRLGVYGGRAGISPAIDALADDAVVFTDGLAPSPWTLPSHMSMLTGLDPVAHGVRRAGWVLSRHVDTLAELLAAAGFRTAAFTDGGFVSGRYGFEQGFEIYRDQRDPDGPNGFARLLPEALDWMRDRARQEDDYFVFIHTFDAHSPYQDGDPEVVARFREREAPAGPDDWALHHLSFLHQQAGQGLAQYGRMSEVLNAYDAGVFEADRGVGRILAVLEETGRLEEALIIITSDHGESFFDHGLHVGHGLGLTDDELRIPLIVRFPRGLGAGRRIDATVDLLDLPPTVLETFGLEAGRSMTGESLGALVRDRRRRRQFVFGMSQNTASFFLVRDGYKYITPLGLDPLEVAKRHLGPMSPPVPTKDWSVTYTRGRDESAVELRYDFGDPKPGRMGDPLGMRDPLPQEEQLFLREQDPGERHNLAAEQPERVAAMRAFLEQVYERSDGINTELFDEEIEVREDPHERNQLAQLGYLDSGSRDDLKRLPLTVRNALKHPFQRPDTALLVSADRAAHRVRLLLREGKLGPDSSPAALGKARRALQRAGDQYLKWVMANVDHWARVTWRLWDLHLLAEGARVTLDEERWVEQSRRAFAEPPKQPRPRKN